MIFNEPRRIVFRLMCAKDGQEGKFREVDAFPFDLSECEVVLELLTKAGCPLNYVPKSQLWKVWMMLGFMVLFYFAMGTVLNCISGARGAEAVPHSKQLIQSVYLACAMFTCCSFLCPRKGKKSEYEEV